MNRKVSITDTTCDEILGYWNYDLFTKNPGVAYNEDGIKVTDLDLATFFFALASRNAVINIPQYKAKGPTRVKANETVLANTNRHGQILNLTSNKETFTFGVRIKDMNVMVIENNGSQTLGAFRTFLLTGFDGDLYKGWKRIEFSPSAKENDFLNQKDLWNGRTLVFDRFINSEKWISFYGKYYFLAKALIDRLVEERSYLKKEIGAMRDAGIIVPSNAPVEAQESDYVPTEEEEYDTKKIWCFEAEVDVPESEINYPVHKHTVKNLIDLSVRVKDLNNYVERLRFLTRTIELAFSNKHPADRCDKMEFDYPGWIKGFGWEKDFTFPGKRNKWYRLKIMQPSVGEFSVALRFRWTEKSQKVKKEPEIV